MRKLMWFGAGFTGACLLGAYFLPENWLGIFALCLLPISVGLLLLFREVCWQRVAAFGLLGLSAGMGWFWLFGAVSLAPARAVDGQTLTIRAEATDYSYATDYGMAVDAKIILEDGSFQGKLYLDRGPELRPGDKIEGEFLLCFTGPEGEKRSEYHSGTGVFLLAYQRGDANITNGQGDSLLYFPARLRRQINRTVDRIFPNDTAAFARALLLGDTSGIDYETDTALTASGIVHVVSVSGLHVSILFSLLFMLIGRRKYLTPIVGTAVLLFVAAVTGFSPSIVRSALMNCLVLLALMAEREYDPLTALAFALVVMLGFNPLCITSVGLQLSAASVLGINLFSGGIGEWIRSRNFWAEARRRTPLARIREWVASTVSVSLSATIATAPLTAMHFGTVSLVGLFTNLAVLWVVNYVFIGILFCVVLSFWTWGAAALGWVLSWGIRYVLWIAGLFGGFPLAVVYTESPYIVAWLVCVYLMLGLFIAAKRKLLPQLCLWTALTLAAALTLSYLEPRLDVLRVTVLDVGQGQCVLLQSRGKTYMVDCGGSRDTSAAADKAVATLHSQGIFRLDGLILTHYDRDHVGGAQYLLGRMPAEQVYLPVGPGQEQWEGSITKAAYGRWAYVQEDKTICWEDVKLSIYAFSGGETSNESSLCVLFQKEDYDILITGDQNVLGERVLLAEKSIPKLDALVIGHHGSDSSTGDALLEQTAPRIALISVGTNNAYGHPAPSVLERLERYGCIVRRTDEEGTIIIRR